MRRSGWDATRRNRNIGTAKAGRGQNNRLVIPESWADNRLFYEKLENPISLTRKINGNSLTFLIEATRNEFYHACTPQDIERVLELIPPDHLAPIKIIVLRQPKRKEFILQEVWGRLQYWANIERYSGPAVHLNAQPRKRTIRWDKSLTPAGVLELELLRRDGHQVRSDRRYHYIYSELPSVRYTQLYRTLPHEIGHYVDYIESVEKPAGDSFDKWKCLNKLYISKPINDKEAFAHRYATEFFNQQSQIGTLPFDRLFDVRHLVDNGLDPNWFSDKKGV